MIDAVEFESGDILTAEQLERVAIPGKSTELIRGRLVVQEPPGTFHGRIAADLARFVGNFVEERDLGAVFAQDTGFMIASNPDTVRAPDLAFVAKARLSEVSTRGYATMAPDLIAEILSPDDRPSEVAAKLDDWLAAGVQLAWVIDPAGPVARAYRADGSMSLIEAAGDLDGERVLDGFRFPFAKLFR